MRRWLLVATDGDPIDSLGRASIKAFTSGDGDEPMEGDLNHAVIDLYDRIRDERGFAREEVTVVLVPIDDARGLTFTVSPKAELVAHGSL